MCGYSDGPTAKVSSLFIFVKNNGLRIVRVSSLGFWSFQAGSMLQRLRHQRVRRIENHWGGSQRLPV